MRWALLLWGCAALLAGAVAAEIAWPDAEEAPAQARPAAAPAARPPRPPDQVGAWAATLLARPPFAADRRPPPGAATGTVMAELPRLAGIMMDGGARSALFANAGGRTIVAQEGAHLGAFEVRAIRADEVLLAGPDGPRTLRPSFVKAEGAPMPAPLPSPPPPQPPIRARVAPQGPNPLSMLPQAPATDATPFDQSKSPSGAAIFGNAPPPGGGNRK